MRSLWSCLASNPLFEGEIYRRRHAGACLKLSHYTESWNARWLLLEDGVLHYWKREVEQGTQKPRGSFVLRDFAVGETTQQRSSDEVLHCVVLTPLVKADDSFGT